MPNPRHPDFIRMACMTASVSFRELLTSDELVGALLSGKVPENRRPHLRTLLDEAPQTLVAGLVQDVGRLTKSGKVVGNLQRIARELDALPRVQDWLRTI